MTVSRRTANDYEMLRAAVLGAEPARGPDLGMVRHRGLASWLKQPLIEPIAQPSCARRAGTPGAIVDVPATTELTRLIAGIVVALAAEPANA
jgi:hypothetical protein